MSLEVKCADTVYLGDTLTVYMIGKEKETNALKDADAVPTYNIYEEETGTAILTQATNELTAKLNDAGTTGLYSVQIPATTAKGFEINKTYCIYAVATVDEAATGGIATFRVLSDPLGPGDYAVTLTIKTTGGTAISGVSVWLNTASARSGAVAGPKTTNDSGLVTFYLHYTAYNIYCHKAGYSFAAATMTPASGSVTFSKSIGTAATVGGSTGYSDSFLSRATDMVRHWIDEPAINKKYDDTDVLELLEFSYIHVIAEKNRNSQTPAVAKITVTVAADTTEYILPYTVGTVEAIYESESHGGKVFYSSRSRYNPAGRRVWIEGNILNIQTAGWLATGTELTIEYIPSGTARLHHGTCTLGTDGTTATFGASPNVGTLDTHHNAYTGCTFRMLNIDGTTITGNYQQERQISGYVNTTRVATLSPALSPVGTTDDGSIYYEIAPAIHKGLDLVVALYTAFMICSIEGNVKRAKSILTAYQTAIRNVRLQAYNSNVQEASEADSDNFDNRFYTR